MNMSKFSRTVFFNRTHPVATFKDTPQKITVRKVRKIIQSTGIITSLSVQEGS